MNRLLPPSVSLCSRFKDGAHCLGQIYRDVCTRCGAKGTGVLYDLKVAEPTAGAGTPAVAESGE